MTLCWSSRLLAADPPPPPVHYWVKPITDPPTPPSGDGSESNPATFNNTTVNQKLAGNDLDLTVHFLPGNYLVLNQMVIGQGTGSGTRTVRLKGEQEEGGPRPRLILHSVQDNPSGAANWNVTTLHHWLLKGQYLNRIEVENLELDGNFDNQGAFASPANMSGYKSIAVDVAAKSGFLRNLLVKRFGAVGTVPWSYFNGAGTETFPVTVLTKDEGQTPVSSDPAPWLIEQVELSEFKSIHAGYATLIMPVVQSTQPNPPDNAEPLIVVRRCQVRGNVKSIAFGTAGSPGVPTNFKSRRIRFEDNVVLNSGVGLNTDTMEIGWLTLRRNAFLDVGAGAVWGRALDGLVYPAPHHNYTIEDNLYRLRGRRNWPVYHNYDEQPSGALASDPNLPLGRPYSDHAYVLKFQGRATKLSFRNNWITTWPADDFQWPLLGNQAPQPIFHTLWGIPSDTWVDARIGPRIRNPLGDVTLADCRVSKTAFEFKKEADNSDLLPNGGFYASLTATVGAGTFAQGYQRDETPPALAVGAFRPRGKVERVKPDYDGTTGQLLSVREIVLGECTATPVSGGIYVTAPVRVMDHFIPNPADVTSRTVPVQGQRAWVQAELVANGQVIPLSAGDAAQYESTDSNGIMTKMWPLFPEGTVPSHAVIRLRAWNDPINPNGSGTLDIDAYTWASHEIPLGTVVNVTALPDVGDDKNTIANKRAKLLLKRIAAVPAGQTSPPITVKVELPLGNWFKPGQNGPDLTATYGFSGSADYYLTGGNFRPTNPVEANKYLVDIPASASGVAETTVELSVVTRADNLTEANVVTLKLLPDPNTSSPSYVTGTSSRADVLLYDGPEWTLYELSLSNFGGPTSVSAAYAINEKSGTTEPRIAGTGTYMSQNQYGQYVPVSYSGWWQWPSPGTFNQIYNSPYYGISTSPVKLVGWQGANAYVATTVGGFTQLPDLFTAAWQATAAWGINPSATYIVGSSKNSAARLRPVAWSSALNIYDLGGSASSLWEGYAKAVNDQTQFAGQFHVEYTGGSVGNFAFRTKPGAFPIEFNAASGAGDMLHAIGISPSTDPLVNREGEAAWVAENGKTVGWSKTSQNKREATYWDSTVPASSVAATRLFGWQAQSGGAVEEYSAAKGINASGWIVGWSGATDSPSRAVLKRTTLADLPNPKAWQDLNDKHFIHGTSGWILKSADAINDLNYIAGNGTLYGQPRAFLLVPRTSGN